MPASFYQHTSRCLALRLALLAFLFCCPPASVAQAVSSVPPEGHSSPSSAAPVENFILTEEEWLDVRCLLTAYPSISHVALENGAVLLVMENGTRVVYRAAFPAVDDVQAAMRQPYPLEPQRSPTPAGVAPGRVRSPALLAALYGATKKDIRAQLVPVSFLHGAVWLHREVADAFRRVAVRLQTALEHDPSLRPWLKPDGGFAWRRIAGEPRLSAHAYGIAVDFSAHRAAYWRWSRLRPHPQQQTYPTAIVQAFEAEGFIWGGKWHEYDIMHFEYRPELLCKARIQR